MDLEENYIDFYGKEIKTFHPNWMKNIFRGEEMGGVGLL